MISPWSKLSDTDFMSDGVWSIGQGSNAPDRQLLRQLLRTYLDRRDEAGDPSLIEVGFGTGIDIRALAREDLLSRIEYRGYDLTPEFVQRLRNAFPEETFEQADLMDMGDVAPADFIWSRHVLEHVEDGYLGLANLWRATRDVLLISWFIRPTWSEAEVRCGIAEGFLHWTYSARRMIEAASDLGAYLYRFDFDNHATLAAVWMLTSQPRPDLAETAHRFCSSPAFLRNALSRPWGRNDRAEALIEVVADAGKAISDLDDIIHPAVTEGGQGIIRDREAVLEARKWPVKIADVCRAAHFADRPLDRYDTFVFWGFDMSMDSIRHIYRHFIHALEAQGRQTLWVPDMATSLDALHAGTLVFGVDVEGRNLKAVPGVDYVLHNFSSDHQVWNGLEDHRFIRLQTYTKDAEQYGVMWEQTRRWDEEAQTLFQPWGTDLLVDEFMEPVFNGDSREAWFVGAVWDDGGLGNQWAIGELADTLDERDLALCLLTQVSDEENVEAVRKSRIAPAFAGKWQVEHNYLPCRVFKNVSYGQVALTNVPKFREIFAGCSVDGETITETVDEALSLSEEEYGELVVAQQQIVAQYTYRESLAAIGRALEEVK